MSKITYDADADVLYVSYTDGPAYHNTDENGVMRRYGFDGQLHGITILDFALRLRSRQIDFVE
jgi:uncharacterized protein YuzE